MVYNCKQKNLRSIVPGDFGMPNFSNLISEPKPCHKNAQIFSHNYVACE